jgi:hypothetical protein
MKYIKLFENFLNEELRSSTYYDFSKFLQRDIVELAKRTKGLDVENIKSVVVDSIIEFYEIEDNEQNRDKVNKSFVLQSLPLENPDFYEVIVRQYYILDKDTEKDRRLRTDFYNNLKFIEIVDNKEWDRYYDRIEELLENPNKFPKYKMPQWERELWQQLKQGWKGQVHQKGIDALRKKLSVYFPEEIKSKEETKDIGFFVKTDNDFASEDSKKLYEIDFTITTLENILKNYLFGPSKKDIYSQVKESDVYMFLDKLREYLENNLDLTFNSLDSNRQTDFPYLSEYVNDIKNLSTEKNIIKKSDKIDILLTEFSEWLKVN